jgi:mono/diheme cytochrome c family protein
MFAVYCKKFFETYKFNHLKTTFTFIIAFLLGAFALMSFSENGSISDGSNQDRWLAPASAKDVKNPYSGKASIKQGKDIYKMRCVVCHGEKGKGDGPAGKALNPPAADHSSAMVQNQTDGELFWKISEGRGPMVGWKLILSEEDRWHVVNYLRTLKEK